jgi:hypothetical protein
VIEEVPEDEPPEERARARPSRECRPAAHRSREDLVIDQIERKVVELSRRHLLEAGHVGPGGADGFGDNPPASFPRGHQRPDTVVEHIERHDPDGVLGGR